MWEWACEGACADCGWVVGQRALRPQAEELAALAQEWVAERGDWFGALSNRLRATPAAAKVAAVARRVTTWVTMR